MKILYMLVGVIFSLSLAAKPLDVKSLSYNAILSDVQYPFPVQHFALDSQGQLLDMAYMYLPPTDNKEVVVLLHGKNFNSAYWQSTASYLHKQGYGVLMPDQIGFGKSSKPLDYQYSFAALASHTKALMSSLDIKQGIILGHSMGGMLASRFALLYPESTAKLLLVNPIGLENYLLYSQYKDVSFFYQQELKKSAESIQAYQKKNYYAGNWNQAYAKLTYFLIGQVQGPDKDIIAHVNALTYDMIFTQPVIDEFSHIKVPTRLILGTRDRTAPGRNWQKAATTYELGRYDKLGERVVHTLQYGKLYQLSGLGHLPQIEDFDRFKAVLNEALK
ncbi:alpha/beta fold hydrolase [Paraglaciecola sp. L1A13]|uniref:alpha/beta fold hydrolase n=1 Tax=Paraglaciecola sp. L1A13 TaxID=2686359 RepID=UPI00131E7AEB|nr:alpha/beta hydrolase [Paraglaciecola sp. L1A13]